MNTHIDIGLSRYSDWAFTGSVVVLVLALMLLAVELASTHDTGIRHGQFEPSFDHADSGPVVAVAVVVQVAP